MPASVWIAIGPREWRPRLEYPPVRIVQYAAELLKAGIEKHDIGGIRVPIFGVAKTVEHLFRYKRIVGESLAIEGLREALRQKKATPAQIARYATEAGVWERMEPYMTALTGHA